MIADGVVRGFVLRKRLDAAWSDPDNDLIRVWRDDSGFHTPVLLLPDDGAKVVVGGEELQTLRRLLMLVDTYNGMTLPVGIGEEVREVADAARAILGTNGGDHE